MLLKAMHVTRLPEVRASVRNGTFQVYDCAGCGVVFHVERSTVYTDFEAGHYVAVEPLTLDGNGAWIARRAAHAAAFDAAFTFGPDVAVGLAGTLTKRLVPGHLALREKLLAWDAGLDDRALEALKLDALAALRLSATDWVFRLLRLLPPGGHLLLGRYRRTPALDRAFGSTRVVAPPRAEAFHTALRSAYDARVAGWEDARARYPWLQDDWVVDGAFGTRGG